MINYGMFLISTSVVIVHFLRLLGSVHANTLDDRSVGGSSSSLALTNLERDTIHGWITEDRHYRIRRFVQSLWAPANPRLFDAYFEFSSNQDFASSSYFEEPEASDSGEVGENVGECDFSQFESQTTVVDPWDDSMDSTTVASSGEEQDTDSTISDYEETTSPSSEVPLVINSRNRIPDFLNGSLEHYGCHYTDQMNEVQVICENKDMTEPIRFLDGTRIEMLTINCTNISVLGPSAFGEAEVRSVRLHYNQLQCIHPQAFKGLRRTLVLSLNNNKLRAVDFKNFVDLAQLTAMFLENNHINLASAPTWYMLNESDSQGEEAQLPILPKLSLLSLVGNPLRMIPRNFFRQLKDSPVEILYLMNTQLRQVDPGAFQWLHALRDLDLSENPDLMPYLRNGFYGIPKTLRALQLLNNNLVKVPTDVLELVQDHLVELNLSGNLFDTISSSSFPLNMTSLQHLNLKGCRIRSLSTAAFSHLTSLETLNLRSNRLNQVPSTIQNLRSLRTLLLSGNDPASSSAVWGGTSTKRFHIPNNVFHSSSSLTVLYLDNLPIFHIANESLTGLSSLQELYLYGNSIQTIEDYAFKDLTNLTRLDLSSNSLETMGGYIFYGLGGLRSLDLQNNQINMGNETDHQGHYTSTTPPKDYDPTPDTFNPPPPVELPVEEDTYDDGSLIVLPPVPILPISSAVPPFKFLPTLKNLNMANNRLRCLVSAHLEYLTSLQYLDLTGNVVSSWQYPILSTLPNLTIIKMSKNNIGPISDAMLQDFTNIEQAVGDTVAEVDLTNNPFVCDSNACQLIKFMQASRTIAFYAREDVNLHICIDISTSRYRQMFVETELVCDRQIENPGPTDSPTGTQPTSTPGEEHTHSPEDQPGPIYVVRNVATIVVIICSVLLAISTGVIGYKKRFHLKYFWFVVKYNFVHQPNLNLNQEQKAVDSEYDFDIFLSYCNTDRTFVADHLVPQIEGAVEEIGPPPPPSANVTLTTYNERKTSILSIVSYKSTTELVPNEAPNAVSPIGHQQPKLKVCIHERDFTAGVPITENIVDFVDRSRKVVVVVSKDYLQSQWCLYEMNLAYHRLIESGRSSFLVILLENIPPTLRTKSLNFLLLSRTYLEWPGSEASEAERSQFWKRLNTSLSSM